MGNVCTQQQQGKEVKEERKKSRAFTKHEPTTPEPSDSIEEYDLDFDPFANSAAQFEQAAATFARDDREATVDAPAPAPIPNPTSASVPSSTPATISTRDPAPAPRSDPALDRTRTSAEAAPAPTPNPTSATVSSSTPATSPIPAIPLARALDRARPPVEVQGTVARASAKATRPMQEVVRIAPQESDHIKASPPQPKGKATPSPQHSPQQSPQMQKPPSLRGTDSMNDWLDDLDDAQPSAEQALEDDIARISIEMLREQVKNASKKKHAKSKSSQSSVKEPTAQQAIDAVLREFELEGAVTELTGDLARTAVVHANLRNESRVAVDRMAALKARYAAANTRASDVVVQQSIVKNVRQNSSIRVGAKCTPAVGGFGSGGGTPESMKAGGGSTSEKRVSPDGNAYTKAEFVEYFGGSEEWDAAGISAADVGG